MATYSEVVKNLRTQKKWSQRQLAINANISNTEVSRIENGHRDNPSLATVEKLAKVFGITVNDFLSHIDNGQDIIINNQPKKPRDLRRILENEDYTLNGEIATQEDKEKLQKIIEALYYDAKEKNKRKK